MVVLARYSIVLAFVLLALLIAPTARADCGQNVDCVLQSVNQNRVSPLNNTQAQFVRDYSTALMPKLRDLDNFVDALNAPTEGICNLLCRKGIVPRFWVSQSASPVDLIRYVFTSTCYGVTSEHRPGAFKLLNTIVAGLNGTTAFDAAAKLFEPLSPTDQYFMRNEFGDMLRSVDPAFNVRPSFPSATLLWQQAHKSRSGSAPTRSVPAQPPLLSQLAKDACASSFVNKTALVRQGEGYPMHRQENGTGGGPTNGAPPPR
jgi:hypothetical protein